MLGIGRSGTSWAFRTLATSDTPMHAWLEPLHRMSPQPTMSPKAYPGEFSSAPFISRMDERHPLRLTLNTFASGCTATVAPRAEVRHGEDAQAVLIKEVHALLAMPAFLADPRMDAKAVVILRDPVVVADSVFDAQGLETRYLVGESARCESPWLLERLLTPEDFTHVRSVQQRLATSPSDCRVTRVLQFVLTAALIQHLLAQTAERLPNVMAVDYDTLCGAPHRTFESLAAHLDLRWGSASMAEVVRTTTGRHTAAASDPYGVVRDTRAQLDRPMRFLTESETQAARDMLADCGLSVFSADAHTPAAPRLAG